MNNKINIKNCPFCDGEAVLQKFDEGYSICCFGNNCNIVPITFFGKKKDVIRVWNKRVDKKENNNV